MQLSSRLELLSFLGQVSEMFLLHLWFIYGICGAHLCLVMGLVSMRLWESLLVKDDWGMNEFV